MFQLNMVKKRCSHMGMKEDPHDYCRRCAEKYAGFVCDGWSTVCDVCADLPAATWKAISIAVGRNARKRKPAAMNLNVSKASADLESEEPHCSIDFSTAKPTRYKAADLLFPDETLDTITDNTASLPDSSLGTNLDSQVSLSQAAKMLSQTSDDTLIPASQETPPASQWAISEPSGLDVKAWASYIQSKTFKDWYKANFSQNQPPPPTELNSKQRPSATVTKAEMEQYLSSETEVDTQSAAKADEQSGSDTNQHSNPEEFITIDTVADVPALSADSGDDQEARDNSSHGDNASASEGELSIQSSKYSTKHSTPAPEQRRRRKRSLSGASDIEWNLTAPNHPKKRFLEQKRLKKHKRSKPSPRRVRQRETKLHSTP